MDSGSQESSNCGAGVIYSKEYLISNHPSLVDSLLHLLPLPCLGIVAEYVDVVFYPSHVPTACHRIYVSHALVPLFLTTVKSSPDYEASSSLPSKSLPFPEVFLQDTRCSTFVYDPAIFPNAFAPEGVKYPPLQVGDVVFIDSDDSIYFHKDRDKICAEFFDRFGAAKEYSYCMTFVVGPGGLLTRGADPDGMGNNTGILTCISRHFRDVVSKYRHLPRQVVGICLRHDDESLMKLFRKSVSGFTTASASASLLTSFPDHWQYCLMQNELDVCFAKSEWSTPIWYRFRYPCSPAHIFTFYNNILVFPRGNLEVKIDFVPTEEMLGDELPPPSLANCGNPECPQLQEYLIQEIDKFVSIPSHFNVNLPVHLENQFRTWLEAMYKTYGSLRGRFYTFDYVRRYHEQSLQYVDSPWWYA